MQILYMGSTKFLVVRLGNIKVVFPKDKLES